MFVAVLDNKAGLSEFAVAARANRGGPTPLDHQRATEN